MQAIEIKKTGGPGVLELKDIKLEDPKDGEVLIKHSAIGLNYIDTYHRSGLYPLPLPSGIGLEAAGIIEKIGNNVGDFKEGKRDGIGIFTYENGNKYVGEFKNGTMDGQGTFTYPNGDKRVGVWRDGKPVN